VGTGQQTPNVVRRAKFKEAQKEVVTPYIPVAASNLSKVAGAHMVSIYI
jgi:hypothetical protein